MTKPEKITAREALYMALIDAIESREALAAGDPERREMHRAYVVAYRKLMKRRFGQERTPIERRLDHVEFVQVWPPPRSK